MSMLRRVDVDMVVRTRRETVEQSEAMLVHRPMRGESVRGTGEEYGGKGDRKRDGERKTVKSCARV